MSNFFRKSPAPQVDAKTATEWLCKMVIALDKVKSETIVEKFDHRNLFFFTNIYTLEVSLALLREVPSSVLALDSIMLELKLYFDSIWQLYLLNKYIDQKEKISKLYAIVDLDAHNFWKAFFANNQRIETVLDNIIKKHDYRAVSEANEVYVLGQRTSEQEKFASQIRHVLKDNPNFTGVSLEITSMFLFKIKAILNKAKIDFNDQFVSLFTYIYEETSFSLTNKLLTEFDLNKCEVIELPPEWYQKL